jgi:hypothetical protein
VAVAYNAKLLRQRELAGILHMAAVDHVADRLDAALGVADENDRADALEIHTRHLFAFAQIGERSGPLACRHPVRNTAAHAALIKPEHEAGAFRCTTVDERIDAQGAVRADQPRRNPLGIVEARLPDQRAITEHPEILLGVVEAWIHFARGR